MTMHGGGETTREDRAVNDPVISAMIDLAVTRLQDGWPVRGTLENLVWKVIRKQEGGE